MDLIVTAGQALLGIALLIFGLGATLGVRAIGGALVGAGWPRWLRVLAGALQALGGAALLAGLWLPPVTAFAGIGLALVLAVVLIAAAVRPGPRWRLIGPGVLLAAALAISAIRPLGLQLATLTQPDALPIAVVPAREVATYAPGAFLESVALDRQGNIYLARTTGADFSTFDFSAARAEIVRRAPDGRETVFAALPAGAAAGVLAIAADETLYLTVAAPTNPAAQGVWRFTANGQGTRFAALPAEAGPNGITIGPDGQLYVADSNLGAIWRIDAAGRAEQWTRHPQLGRRPLLGLFPGANGLHFWQSELYVAVSDRGQIVRVPLLPDGRAGRPEVFVRGVPTDDFVFDGQGNLYATTHPFDTVVRVTPDGERTVIATAAEGIVGPTAAAWGALPGDEAGLYVVTDGGLFAQHADPRPALVRLDIGALGAAAR